MVLGTHNSATGGKLVWWQKPLAWIINPTSKCQDKSITEQLADGVRWFNLQVACINGKWKFTHGMAIYKEDVLETLKLMRLCASVKEPIYFQLYLDRCFWCKQNKEAFRTFVKYVNTEYCNTYFIMSSAWIEGTKEYPHKRYTPESLTERYWTLGWVKAGNANNWIDKLPLPKYHAKKYNDMYKKQCKTNYLMLDFYTLGGPANPN